MSMVRWDPFANLDDMFAPTPALPGRSGKSHFSSKEIVDLTLAIVAINAWNRLGVTFHAPVGSYRPQPE